MARQRKPLLARGKRAPATLDRSARNLTVFMPDYVTQQASAGQRRTRWLPSVWHKGLLLGVLMILMSLCHGVVAPVDASTASDGTVTVAVADDEQSPFRDCAASKRLVALSERRGSVTALYLPADISAFTAHIPETTRGLRLDPLPIPANHRAFLQVFRI